MFHCRFSLTDHHGRPVTENTYRDKFLLVYFGFTHCRAVCPASLNRTSEVLNLLGANSERVQALYISVDPERDTPQVMKTYLEEKYPRILGLTGTMEQVGAAKKVFHVFAKAKPDEEDPDGYVVPHTAFLFLIGPDGNYLTHFPDHLAADTVASRIQPYLNSGSGNGMPQAR